ALDNRESEPGSAAAAPRRIAAGKWTLEAIDLFRGDPRAAVAYFDHHRRAFAARGNVDRGAAVAERVVDKIGKEPRHRGGPHRQCRKLAGAVMNFAAG